MSLEKYLRDAAESGAIDHALRVQFGPNGECDFYIHPMYIDGDTLDYTVAGDSLERLEMGAGSRAPVDEGDPGSAG